MITHIIGKVVTFLANGTATILQEGDKTIISKLKEVFRNSIFSISTHILNLGINLVIAILLARWLGAKALGQYTLGTSLTGIIFAFVNFGIQGILIREIAKDSSKAQEYLGNSLGIRLLVSLPLGIGISYMLALVMGFQGETLTLILLASIFTGLSSLTGIFYGMFEAFKRFEYEFAYNLFYKITSLFICFFLLLKGYGLISVFILFAVLQLITGTLAIVKISQIICPVRLNINWRFWRPFIRASFPLALAGTMEFVNLKIDAVILSVFKEEIAVGIYNGAYNIYIGATILPYAFIVAFYPTISQVYKSSREQASRLFRNIFILAAIGTCVLALIFSLFSEFIVTLFYGKEFISSATLLMILACGLPFLVLNRLCNYTLIAMGLQKWMFYVISFGAIFNVIANIILIPQYSYVGASITTVVTEGLVFFAGLWKIYYSFNQKR